jgi:N-acetylmuramoyl-L-alanine amidase
MKIALCAGHRKDSKGAVNEKHNLNEYDEALKVIIPLTEILVKEGHSISTFSGKLSEKIKNINRYDFDLAIDLHFNAAAYKGRGCEVMYVPGSTKRHDQAEEMSREIALYMNLRNRGAKQGWYWGGENPGTKPNAFLSKTNCAAFIPEPLFIDNDKEVEYWLVAGRHAQIAEAIATGIATGIES